VTTLIGADAADCVGAERSPMRTSLDPPVRRALATALDWVGAEMWRFDPFTERGSLDFRKGKQLLELATVLACYVRLTGDSAHPVVVRGAGTIAAWRSRPAFRDWITRRPAALSLFLDVYAFLRLLGHDDDEFRAVLQRVLDARFADHAERVPHRKMDVRLSVEWGGLENDAPGMREVVGDSLVARAPSPLLLDEFETYTLTHLIMFYYRHGTTTDVEPIVPELEELRSTLSGLLVMACQDEHWDLLAELLLCWDCVGFEIGGVERAAWDALLASQRPDGAFPGPASWPADAGEQPKGAADFAANYHTTVVGALACALRVNREAAT
jgi:hypothetical protein